MKPKELILKAITVFGFYLSLLIVIVSAFIWIWSDDPIYKKILLTGTMSGVLFLIAVVIVLRHYPE